MVKGAVGMFDGLYIPAMEPAQATRTAMSAPPRECMDFQAPLDRCSGQNCMPGSCGFFDGSNASASFVNNGSTLPGDC